MPFKTNFTIKFFALSAAFLVACPSSAAVGFQVPTERDGNTMFSSRFMTGDEGFTEPLETIAVAAAETVICRCHQIPQQSVVSASLQQQSEHEREPVIPIGRRVVSQQNYSTREPLEEMDNDFARSFLRKCLCLYAFPLAQASTGR